jgi:ubiquitin carboxyl-terminal hydrolase 8
MSLANLGNTCYINTTIQCLGHCDVFLRFILDSDYENNLISQCREIYHELYVNKNSIMPNKFIKYLGNNISDINIYRQNDIHEFLTIFIEKLNKVIAININPKDMINNNKYSHSDYDIQRLKMDLSWYETLSKEYSPLVNIFYGQSVSQIICGNCDKIYHNYEIYTNLMIPITSQTTTIYDCLNELFKEEHIEHWTCDNCKQKHKSTKTTKLWKIPPILIISLKRFTDDLRKINNPINIPEVLNLAPYSIPQTNTTYELKAVAHHSGSANSGHYYATCLKNNNWYNYDDLDIKQINKPNHDNGYILFYTL